MSRRDASRGGVRRGSGARTVVVWLLWGGLAASMALWWLDTPAGSLANRGDWFIAAGRITGLVAGYLLLVVTLLRSRLGALERWVGSELTSRWHRELGAAVLVTTFAHMAFVLYGYALIDRRSMPAELVLFLRDYEGIVGAVVAAVVLAEVGILAVRAVRALLPYAMWRTLHAFSYLALLLGYGHQFALGQQMSRPGPGRTLWIALYVIVLVALVWGRLVGPALLNLRHRFRVAQVVIEGPDTVSIYLAGRQLHKAGRAGQFFRWRFLTRPLWTEPLPLSLSAVAKPGWLRLTVRVVGEHTAALRDLRPGVRVWAQGPMGAFTAVRRTRALALLVAAGSGISPIRALLEELPSRAAVIYRESTPRDVVFRGELERLAGARRAIVWYVIGPRDDPAPRALMTGRGLRELVPDVRRRDVYLSGPPGFVTGMAQAAQDAGVRRRQIHQIQFEL